MQKKERPQSHIRWKSNLWKSKKIEIKVLNRKIIESKRLIIPCTQYSKKRIQEHLHNTQRELRLNNKNLDVVEWTGVR